MRSWSNVKINAYQGKIPFGVNFSNRLAEINSKFGMGYIIDNQGFYGRTYQWIIQDSLKMTIQLQLPRTDKEYEKIEFISLSKKK